MFSPIAAYPIGGTESTTPSIDVVGAGTLDFTGLAAGGVKVAGVGASTLSFTLSAAATQATVAQASFLGWGPLASGAIAEVPASSSTLTTVTGAGAGTFGITGLASAGIPIFGRAPDVIIDQWDITPGDASATIADYPTPPTTPAWSIVVEAPGFRVVDYPTYSASVASVPFFDITGVATGGADRRGAGAFTIPFTGASAGRVTVGAIGAGSVLITGLAAGSPVAGGVGAFTIPFTGQGTGAIGVFAMSGRAAGDLDILGEGTLSAIAGGVGAGEVTFTLDGQGSVTLTGAITGFFDITGAGKFGKLSSKRMASPLQSANGGKILSPQEFSRIIGA